MVSRTGTGLTHRSYFISIQAIHILLEAYFPVIKTLSERSRTHSVMASANPGLGASAILPSEVRRLIWEHFHPKGHDISSSSRTQKTHLSILHASRQLYKEVSTYLFSDFWLEFENSPLYERDSWVNVYICPRKSCWKLRDAADARSRGFLNLPYRKTEPYIFLLAPDPKDPG